MTITDHGTRPATTRQGFEYVPPRPMPSVDLRLRLATSPSLRRLIPTSLAVARAQRKAQRLFDEHEATRAHALRTMDAVVRGTEREDELEQLARRYVVESEIWEALFWQPWRPPSMDEPSRRRLLETCQTGRGTVLSTSHLGPFFCKSLALVELGLHPAVVCGDFWFEQPSNDRWGRRLARWTRGAPLLPCVRPRGSFEALAALLEEGGLALIYFDLPGRHETRFLGKPVELVDGTARLAVATDALVLPMRSVRDGQRVRLRFGEPVDPREHGGSVDEVHAALARIHERDILEEPAALQDPGEFGWKDQATPTAWRRPARQGAPVTSPVD